MRSPAVVARDDGSPLGLDGSPRPESDRPLDSPLVFDSPLVLDSVLVLESRLAPGSDPPSESDPRVESVDLSVAPSPPAPAFAAAFVEAAA